MTLRFLKSFTRADAILIALITLVYARSLGNVFVDLDDQLLIVSNPLAWGLSIQNIIGAFTSYDPELYIPLTLLTYQVQYSLFGLNPSVYHVTSLIIHILSTLLVLRIFTRFFSKNTALLLGLLFGLHPMNTEAVSWASGLKDVLSSFFFLLSVWSYLRWKSDGKGYGLSIATFGIGLAAKVSIIPLPLILLLIDWLRKRKAIQEKLPYFALAIVFAIIAMFGKSQMSDVHTWATLSFAGIPFYLGKFFVPLHLSILYPFLGDVDLSNPVIFRGLLITIGLLIAISISLKWTRKLVFSGLWFLLLIIPALPTVIKGGEDGATYLYLASDRYVYLAGLGILFLLGFIINNRRYLQIATVAVIVMFAVLTYKQSLAWRDS
ncbi:MAG: glycosyltransferase family 39 protein, partial [Candidatus Peribacteraceae bacterium]|nr:glycosyltransferase family 39 protein [Candidatus Peribacteraceae bacterium]